MVGPPRTIKYVFDNKTLNLEESLDKAEQNLKHCFIVRGT